MRELPVGAGVSVAAGLPTVLFLALPLVACVQIGTGTGTGSDAGNAGGPTLSAPALLPEAGPTGTNCVEDPGTQTILCERIDVCPAVDVDPGAFPDCGFRMRAGSLLDLECFCGSALCPVGVAASCDQATQLLLAQSALVVCEQQAEGRCVELATPDAGGGACDKACAADCAGAPSCLQLCGC
jgi:hypothetical protein